VLACWHDGMHMLHQHGMHMLLLPFVITSAWVLPLTCEGMDTMHAMEWTPCTRWNGHHARDGMDTMHAVPYARPAVWPFQIVSRIVSQVVCTVRGDEKVSLRLASSATASNLDPASNL
jgi:hypothetical protein